MLVDIEQEVYGHVEYPTKGNLFNSSLLAVSLGSGDKRLNVFFYKDKLRVDSRLDRVREATIPGSTTRLYVAARQLMVDVATLWDKPLNYEFVTEYPTLRAWALDSSKGKGVFDWDDAREHGKWFLAYKKLFPREV